MIGVSLSLCVQDIVKGYVNISDVEVIVAGTRAITENDWRKLIETYQKNYWQEDPETAERIIHQLRAEGKIEQPRVKDNEHSPVFGGKENRWVESRDDIDWADDSYPGL